MRKVKKVKVLDRKGKEFIIKVTNKKLEIQIDNKTDAIMPTTTCDNCLIGLVGEEYIKKGKNFVTVGPLVYIRHFYIRPPYLKCDVCQRRTAQLRFSGLLHFENGKWFYMSKNKNFEKEPFEKAFRKVAKS